MMQNRRNHNCACHQDDKTGGNGHVPSEAGQRKYPFRPLYRFSADMIKDTAAHIIGYFHSFDKFFVFTQNHMPPSKYPLISAFHAADPTERLLLFY